jgi:hypothetical protein
VLFAADAKFNTITKHRAALMTALFLKGAIIFSCAVRVRGKAND